MITQSIYTLTNTAFVFLIDFTWTTLKNTKSPITTPKGPVSIYHLGWAGRICNTPYMNFVHPPWDAFIFIWTRPPPLKQPEFYLLPPLLPKKEKRKKSKRRQQLWHYYIAQTNNELKLGFDCFKSVLTNWLICCQTWSHQSIIWDSRVSSYFWRGRGLNLVSQSSQAQRKQFRVGAARMGASTLGGFGGMLPWEILKFSFSKMHISRILWENWRNAHARDSRYQMSKDWQLQAFCCLKLCP